MTDLQQKLIDFATYVLTSMENTEDWGPDMNDDHAAIAHHLNLAHTNDDGYFRANQTNP